MHRKAMLIALVLVSAAPGYAQTTSGSITGNVVDAQHGAVPNAVVTATELEKKFTFNTKSDEVGRFVFTQVPPGTYRISAESPGFKKYDRVGITLNANDKISIGDLVMEVGTVTEQIEASASAVQLQTESAERSSALVAKQMKNIAVNSRSYLDLVKLVPGVVSTVNLQTAGPRGLASISANGNGTNSNQLTINGISNVDTGSNGSVNVTVSLDSVQEFKILTGVYQAEYGRSMGAQISVVTKSGTSEFHGSSYWFHRNDSLNANNWLNNRNGLPGNRVFDFVRNPPLGIQPVLNYGLVNTINPSSALLSPPDFYAADPVGKIPTVYNFTLGVQRKLPLGMVLDTAYVGALSRHLQDNRNLNYVPYGSAFLPQYQDPTLSSTALLGSSAGINNWDISLQKEFSIKERAPVT